MNNETILENESVNPNLWSANHDVLLTSWRRQATINLWLQAASSYFYKRMHDWLSYPSIIISGITSVSIFGLDHKDSEQFGKYWTSGMVLIVSILIGISKHTRAAENAQDHMLRARDFYSLIREIDVMLITTYKDRPPVAEAMINIRHAFERIIDTSLNPPLQIIRRYEKAFRNNIENELLNNIPAVDEIIKNSKGNVTVLPPSDTISVNTSDATTYSSSTKKKRFNGMIYSAYHLYSSPIEDEKKYTRHLSLLTKTSNVASTPPLRASEDMAINIPKMTSKQDRMFRQNVYGICTNTNTEDIAVSINNPNSKS